ncbi:MAG TPA: L-glutamate gamma-semialdehyde dehydrogenase [bacterium]|nr:L-glutamate gamma-semialdehyde dehydrogenase [bacterium]HQC50318.1 L-glutamate gamma-semialdehyde dehydrogenase [bacterium]
MSREFRNEALTDFTKPENREKMEAALSKVANEFGKEYPLLIGGKRITTEKKIKSYNPARKSEVVGIAQKASKADALAALDAAWKSFESWKRVNAEERAGYLYKLAEKMRAKKYELAATMVYEVSKSWAEADADVAEAIDFCEFYADEAIRYSKGSPCVQYPGETNELRYIPIGVGAVIPPWNFPLAILVGMTTAAAVTGNTVVLKPASDAPIIAARFIELVEEVGIPAGVINFVSGSGSEVGETLITNPNVRFISFTGSKEVGLHIAEECGKTYPGQKWIKRLVSEMGGKDATIVDSEADIDAAVEGVAISAFGFQGQKCSACSRAIVDAKIYDQFVEKLAERVKKIVVGDPSKYGNYMGAVSSKNAFEKICEYIEIGKKEGKLLTGGEASSENGYFIQPTVFTNIDPKARLAQEEIFGPVLAVIKARDFNHAIEIFNNTDYGLTGGIFSKNKDKLSRAKEECYCGNFYINRKITGALVGVQPFGGYNMSGTCSKAGGRDYLGLFLQGKSICEKIL